MNRIGWALVEPLLVKTLIVMMPAMIGATASGAEESRRPERLAIAHAYWEREHERAAGKPAAGGYPTEPALPFLSAYQLTREARFVSQAERQLAYAHSAERNGLLAMPREGLLVAHRDAQARQICNFYLAYRVLADGRYLRWADTCAKAMMATIPRQAHECAGQSYIQFASTFINVDDPQSSRAAYGIDVNQNAEVGLAFGLLCHDPASAFFDNPLAKEIALQETLASMSIQDMKTGAIPLTEASEQIRWYDTAYGSYAAFSWVWSQLLWRDPRMEEHVRAAGRWLGAKMDLSKDSNRYYAFRNPSTSMPPWEASYRLALYWYCGLDASQFIAGLFERMPKIPPGDPFLTLWACYDLMGIPRAYYIDGQPEAAHR